MPTLSATEVLVYDLKNNEQPEPHRANAKTIDLSSKPSLRLAANPSTTTTAANDAVTKGVPPLHGSAHVTEVLSLAHLHAVLLLLLPAIHHR